MVKKSRRLSLEAKKGIYGRIFVLPWVLGFILFFVVPLSESIHFSFSTVTNTLKGFTTKFVGLNNYRYILTESPTIQSALKTSIGSFAYSLPIIVIISLILAVILNQKFKGRIIARAVFFVPVIIASGVVMQIFNQDVVASQLRDSGNSSNAYLYGSINFIQIFMSLGLPEKVITPIVGYLQEIFSLVWNCGVQIILFLAGLQSIPEQLYEVSQVEGATKWEEFWFITLPMTMNILIVVIIYTVIDLFTNADNPVMADAYQMILNNQNYDRSSALIWSYFAIVGVFVGAILLLINRLFLKKLN